MRPYVCEHNEYTVYDRCEVEEEKEEKVEEDDENNLISQFEEMQSVFIAPDNQLGVRIHNAG